MMVMSMFEEEDDFVKYHQTNKFYTEIRNYYIDMCVDVDTPFPVIASHINYCIRKFNTKRHGYKPRHKVIFLSLMYLDEINYPKGH